MLIGKKKKEEVEDICVKGRYTYNVSTKGGRGVSGSLTYANRGGSDPR